MKLTPMLQVADVEASSRWYQDVIGMVGGHGGPDYEMLFEGRPYESALLLQLHRWDAHEHGELGDPGAPRGAGCSLWIQVADRTALDAAFARCEAADASVVEPPHHNPLAHHREFMVRDPDGYTLVLCTPFGTD